MIPALTMAAWTAFTTASTPRNRYFIPRSSTRPSLATGPTSAITCWRAWWTVSTSDTWPPRVRRQRARLGTLPHPPQRVSRGLLGGEVHIAAAGDRAQGPERHGQALLDPARVVRGAGPDSS